MKIIGKRLLSILLSVLLTVGVFSVVPFEVGAAETDSAPVGVNNYHYHFDLQMLEMTDPDAKENHFYADFEIKVYSDSGELVGSHIEDFQVWCDDWNAVYSIDIYTTEEATSFTLECPYLISFYQGDRNVLIYTFYSGEIQDCSDQIAANQYYAEGECYYDCAYFDFAKYSISCETLSPSETPYPQYIERSWDAEKNEVVEKTKLCLNATSISTISDKAGAGFSSKWYIVDSNVTFKHRLNVYAEEVHLILCDGVRLEAKLGIHVGQGKTFVVHGQTNETGHLSVDDCDKYEAGIGSNDEEGSAGTMIFQSGSVYARGNSDAAGIGGGNESNGGNIIIYGGKVQASNYTDAAGIGGGDCGGSGNITVYGGTVIATGGPYGAGIGGGDYDNCDDYVLNNFAINIYGGNIKAQGGKYGAGIGGGQGGTNSPINIYGGTINATGGIDGAGIGGGEDGNAGNDINIYGGNITATGKDCGAGIGGGERGYARNEINIYDCEYLKAIGGTYYFDYTAGILPGTDQARGAGAGIGGGDRGGAKKINIYGGKKIIAIGGCFASGVGHGAHYKSKWGEINISGGNIEAVGNKGDYQWLIKTSFAFKADDINIIDSENGGVKVIDYHDPLEIADKDTRVKFCTEHNGVHIEQCDHYEYTYEADESTHKKTCKYCSLSWSEEHKPTANWEWNDDEKTAACSIVCEDCDYIIAQPEVTISNEIVNPFCVTKGSMTKTASADYDGNTYTTARNYTMEARGYHIYGNPEWAWSDDCSAARIALTCTDCGIQLSTRAVVTGETRDGVTTYTATAELNGSTYTNTKTISLVRSNIVIAAAEHGSVSADKSAAYEGDEITLTVTPDTGYDLVMLSVKDAGGQDIAVNNNKFIMPDSEVTVTAAFDQKDYSVTYAETENGMVKGVYSANFGDKVELSVYPFEGYELDALKVTNMNGGNRLWIEDNKFTMPDFDVKVTATFKKRSLTITYGPYEHGTITGAATAQIEDAVPLTITPDDGYALNNLYAEGDEWQDPAWIFDDTLYMIGDNVTVYAEFVPIIPAKEPWIDENGEYHPGNVAYCEIDGYYFAVENSRVGDQLDSVEVSYFEFEKIKLGGYSNSYQINHYTGPIEELSDLVIPKTYNGRKISFVGDGSSFILSAEAEEHQFTLTLNENIIRINKQAFMKTGVTKVQGDTSKLRYLGHYAFAYVNDAGGNTLDLKLDYANSLSVDYGTFQNIHLTVHLKHNCKLNYKLTGQASLTYDFTDDHNYSEPTWGWSDDYTSATATFVCYDSRCQHSTGALDAEVSHIEFEGREIYLASVELNGKTYYDLKTEFTDGFGARLIGRSISLDGDIGVNFYMELSDDIASSETAKLHFVIPTGSTSTEQDVLVKDARQVISDDGNTYYVFKCHIAAKEMTSEISAQILDEDKEGTVYTYSVKEYADYLLTHTDDSRVYRDAAPLVKAMLNYGAYAQTYFDKNPTDLANADLDENDKVLGDVNIDADDPIDNLPDGVEFVGATLSLKSETTLSLYFRSDEELTFSCGDYTVETVKNGNYQVARIRGIAAKHIGDTFTLNVNDGTITYSPLNYIDNALNGGTEDENLKNAVKALYCYWKAADAYFSE